METRICAALDPVPAGLRRYRVRGIHAGRRLELLYILAARQADAETVYLEQLGLVAADVQLIVGVTPN